MTRFLFSILLVALMAPFHFGCGGEEAPVHEVDNTAQDIDPAQEAENDKKMRNN